MSLIGAAALILAWGRDMQYVRDGVVLFTFKGRRAENRPTEIELIESVDQHNFKIIALTEQFVDALTGLPVRPRKFDRVIDEQGEEYTVQRGHMAGAEVDEVVKLLVTGGYI